MDKTLYDEYDGKIIGLLDYDQPIGVSDYQYSKTIPENLKLALPSVEEVEEELSRIMDI